MLALSASLAGVYLCQLVTLQEPAAAWAWMGSHAGAAGYTYLVLLLAQLLVATLTDSLLCGQLLTLLPCLLAVRRQPSEAGGQRCPPCWSATWPWRGRRDRWRASSAPAWSWGRAPGGHSPGGASVPGGLCLVPPGPAPGR
ncbi:MAG: hypothetical protein ACLRNQ_05215 [Flavonifractor plautii]